MPWEKQGFNQDTYNHLNLRETRLVYLELFHLVLFFLLSVKIHEYLIFYHIRKVFNTFIKQSGFSLL